MISRRNAMAAAIGTLVGATGQMWTGQTWAAGSTPVGQFDTNNDGSVDLAEANKAASDLFDKLDTGKKGVLDLKQFKGRLSRKEFAAADADKDGTLSKEEYLTLVAQRFKAADAKHDGKLVNWEFQTHKGRALVRLLR